MIRAVRLTPIPVTSRRRSGCLLDEIEDGVPEAPDQPLGVDRADAADHPRGQVALDTLQRCRWAGFEERRPELLAVRPVVHPRAAHLDELTRADHRRLADHGRQLTLAPHLDPEHAEARVRVVEGHPLHKSRQGLRR